jgi:hypothetical protein
MDLLEVLVGGGKKRQEYEDFTQRYDQGPPWEGYSDREVLDRYGEVAHKMPAQDYEAAVHDALSRLSPEEQADLLRSIQERTRDRGATAPAPRAGGGGGGLDDLARSVRELHEQPGRLREVLTEPSSRPAEGQARRVPGGAGGGSAGIPGGLENIFASPLAKAALAGITAMLVRRMFASR